MMMMIAPNSLVLQKEGAKRYLAMMLKDSHPINFSTTISLSRKIIKSLFHSLTDEKKLAPSMEWT